MPLFVSSGFTPNDVGPAISGTPALSSPFKWVAGSSSVNTGATGRAQIFYSAFPTGVLTAIACVYDPAGTHAWTMTVNADTTGNGYLGVFFWSGGGAALLNTNVNFNWLVIGW